MIRFVTNAFPLLILLLALFGFVVGILDLEPRSGAVIRLAVFEQPTVPAVVVLGSWMMEACGLLALFLLAQGRCGAWWLDGLVAGWLAWVFRGPLLVLTVVVAARQPQGPWWDIAFGWWILYSICGLSLAVLARRSGVVFAVEPEVEATEQDVESESPSTEAAMLSGAQVASLEEAAAEPKGDEDASVNGGPDEGVQRSPAAEQQEPLLNHKRDPDDESDAGDGAEHLSSTKTVD